MLHTVTSGYRGLQEVTSGYRGLTGETTLQGVTGVTLERVTRGYRGLQEVIGVKRSYKRLQGVTGG